MGIIIEIDPTYRASAGDEVYCPFPECSRLHTGVVISELKDGRFEVAWSDYPETIEIVRAELIECVS